MTLGSVSSSGSVQDALSGRPKVAIGTGASSEIGLHAVNISTAFVSQPSGVLPASLANLTKSGLESVTRSLAIEFADEGIRFNAIAPGVVNTPMRPVETHEFLKQLSPFNRFAEVEEVADLLLYMESAPFLNGEVVHLDGGAHAGQW